MDLRSVDTESELAEFERHRSVDRREQWSEELGSIVYWFHLNVCPNGCVSLISMEIVSIGCNSGPWPRRYTEVAMRLKRRYPVSANLMK